jgi:hypothetical protein
MSSNKWIDFYNQRQAVKNKVDEKVAESLNDLGQKTLLNIDYPALKSDVEYVMMLLLDKAQNEGRFAYGKTRINKGILFRYDDRVKFRGYQCKRKWDMNFLMNLSEKGITDVDKLRVYFGEILPETFYNMLSELNSRIRERTKQPVDRYDFYVMPTNIKVYAKNSRDQPYVPETITSLIVHRYISYGDSSTYSIRAMCGERQIEGLDCMAYNGQLVNALNKVIVKAHKHLEKHNKFAQESRELFFRIFDKYELAHYLGLRGI